MYKSKVSKQGLLFSQIYLRYKKIIPSAILSTTQTKILSFGISISPFNAFNAKEKPPN